MRFLAKSIIPSDEHNFASFARNVPGLKTWKIVILRGATLPPEISAISGSPKFLNLQNFFKIFFEKVDFSRFRRSIFSMMGVRLVRNFFWGDRHRLGVKPHGRPKSRTRPPRGDINVFSSLRELKIQFSRKIMFFPSQILHFSPSIWYHNSQR